MLFHSRFLHILPSGSPLLSVSVDGLLVFYCFQLIIPFVPCFVPTAAFSVSILALVYITLVSCSHSIVTTSSHQSSYTHKALRNCVESTQAQNSVALSLPFLLSLPLYLSLDLTQYLLPSLAVCLPPSPLTTHPSPISFPISRCLVLLFQHFLIV